MENKDHSGIGSTKNIRSRQMPSRLCQFLPPQGHTQLLSCALLSCARLHGAAEEGSSSHHRQPNPDTCSFSGTELEIGSSSEQRHHEGCMDWLMCLLLAMRIVLQTEVDPPGCAPIKGAHGVLAIHKDPIDKAPLIEGKKINQCSCWIPLRFCFFKANKSSLKEYGIHILSQN